MSLVHGFCLCVCLFLYLNIIVIIVYVVVGVDDIRVVVICKLKLIKLI